jgi:hypothetical protein
MKRPQNSPAALLKGKEISVFDIPVYINEAI